MRHTPDFQQGGDQGPINDATRQIAATIHQSLMGELRGNEPAAFEDVVAEQSERYPQLLFGELAMHIAEVDLPADATAADRAKGIVEAMRRITSTPKLFEAVTGAPFSTEHTSGTLAGLSRADRRDEKEVAAAEELRAAIRASGYLERSMVPDKRPIQIHYTGTSAPKKRLMRDDLPAVAQEVTLKAVPANDRQWDVQTYRYWSGVTGFLEPIGRRTATLGGIFTLLAAESSGLRPRHADELQRIVGQPIRLGQISTGTSLKIEYHFRREIEEVPGHEPSIERVVWAMPITLSQAYLGSSRDLPLF